MRIFKTADEMRLWSAGKRRDGKKIAFVPTMGALHEGHLELMRKGRRMADALVVSIYVNPTQFGPNEDLSKYPRDIDGDLAKVAGVGADAAFLPTDEIIYPNGYCTFVEVGGVTENLCGRTRPTHFRGVATVVAKLFNIVSPDIAIFGEKDYQQLVVIKRMVADLSMPIEIVQHEIVRDPDGLAMSSRNAYLSADERSAALSINQALAAAKKLFDSGERRSSVLIDAARSVIDAASIPRIDYIKIVDANTIRDIDAASGPSVMAIAAYVGKARLIDNCILSGC
jgi:pantoate--beta-alanine ligase